ncbi:MAG: DNA glycosylase [Pseudonocardia sp.]|nr:DNA glycosylase [Pseudonocardia sp.]
MAEGDSVARLARRLDAQLRGALIAGCDVRHPRFATTDLTDHRITEWIPRGKHLLLRTDACVTVHSHLRMSGSWTVLGPGKRLPPHVARDLRIALRLEDGRTVAGVALPVLTILASRDEQQVVGHLGPDLLDHDPDDADGGLAEAARRLAAAADTPAVAALLDQRRVAGLGNLWAQELLFLHGTSPWRAAAELDAEPLLAEARLRLRRSVETGAYQNTTGRRAPRHWVYGRARRPCLRCGTPVAFLPDERTPHGRATWWCPSCQAR